METLAVWSRNEADAIYKANRSGMTLICVTVDTASGVRGLWVWLTGNQHAIKAFIEEGRTALPSWVIIHD